MGPEKLMGLDKIQRFYLTPISLKHRRMIMRPAYHLLPSP